MLSGIAAVTFASTDIAGAISAYRSHLGYQLTYDGTVTSTLANAWDTPLVTGRRMVLMAPASSPEIFIRIIDQPETEPPAPHRTFGWNGTEIQVDDTDRFQSQLDGTPFTILGPPTNLAITDRIRMLPALGPSGEFLLLTSVADGAFGIEPATTPVGRVFMVTCGVRNLEWSLDFWRKEFGCAAQAPIEVNMPALNRTYHFPPERKHPILLIKVDGGFYIEFNKYPEEASIRHAPDGGLPGGLAMVTFKSQSTLSGFEKYNSHITDPLYAGRSAHFLRGPDGELVEIIQSVDS